MLSSFVTADDDLDLAAIAIYKRLTVRLPSALPVPVAIYLPVFICTLPPAPSTCSRYIYSYFSSNHTIPSFVSANSVRSTSTITLLPDVEG